MSELKRTILYQAHLDAGATMVDFGGWDMPIQYPEGIIAEHLYCRRHCGIFDVSHMGRIDVEGPDQVAFLQHVLSSNVLALDLNQAQYCIIPDANGYAIDDAYLYRFEEGKYFLVINAGNIDKDWAHLMNEAKNFDVKLTNVSDKYAAIAVQGPESKKILMTLSGGRQLTPENVKNALNSLTMEGKPVRIAKTGYTGEPIGYEGAPMHDPCAVMALIHPEVFTMKPMHVEIETQGEYCRGCTVGDQLGLSGKAPNAQVILDVDRKAFADRLVESMKFYGEGAK